MNKTIDTVQLSKDVAISKEDRFRNIVLLGPPSSRKREDVMLPMIRQDIQNRPDAGIVIFDTDGALTGPAVKMAQMVGRPYLLLDPTAENCPFFNPLAGDEDDVIHDLLTVFEDMMADLPPYIRVLNGTVLSNAIKVLKRLDREDGLDGKNATLRAADIILRNPNQDGRRLIQRFAQLKSESEAECKENAEIARWFLTEYYAERSKTYENAAYMRAQVSEIANDRYLGNILNPDVNKGNLVVEDLLGQRFVLCVSTAKQLLGELSRWFGALMMLKYQQAAFCLDYDEPAHPDQFMYADEFQEFILPDVSNLIIFGYQIRVASTVSFQSWAQIDRGGRAYKQLRIVLMGNLRNTLLFSGISKNDANYYADMFSIMSRKDFDKVASEILSLPVGSFVHQCLQNSKVQQYGISKADLNN